MKKGTFNAVTEQADFGFARPPTDTLKKRHPGEFDSLARTRLSKNFILRDFLFCSYSAANGLSNFPENPTTTIDAGRALCERVLEPVLAHFGRFAITYGYQSRESMDRELDRDDQSVGPHSSSPHHWDRGTFAGQQYARVDILPYCVEDGDIEKPDFGHWLMHNLDLDLCMTWTKSNVFCLTVSPLPRRCWVQWGRTRLGEPKQEMIMGADYWQRVYPGLPPDQRPRHGPSCTGGAMHWRAAR